MHTFIHLSTLIHSGQPDWAISLQGGRVLRENIMFCNFVFMFFSYEKLYPCALGCVFGCVSEQTFTSTKCLWDLSVALNNTTLELSLFASWQTELWAHILEKGHGGSWEVFSGPEMFKTNIFQVRVWQSIVWSYYSQRFWQIAQQLQVSPWCCCCSFTVICSQVHQMRKADIKEGVTWTQVTDSGHSVSVWGQIACSQSVAWLLEWEELIVGHILHQRAPQTSWLSASQGWRKHVLLWIHKEVYPTERHQNKIQLYCDWQIRLSETTKTGS